MAYEGELRFALETARRAGQVALECQRSGVTAEAKYDRSPVTAADRASERLISDAVRAAFPRDGLLGEEGSDTRGESGRVWVIDPIDGTREFVRGNPAWAVLLALEVEGDPKIGVAHFPVIGDTYWGVRGGGAFVSRASSPGTPLHASSINARSEAVVCMSGYNDARAFPFAGKLLDWLAGFWAVRAFGGCMDAVLVASGRADAWIEPDAKPWDIAALRLIGEEAGAVFFNLNGGCSDYGGSSVLCAPGLESELREFLLAK